MPFRVIVSTCGLALAAAACEPPPPQTNAPPPPVVQAEPASPWRTVGASEQAAIADAQMVARIEAATQQARRTAEEARQRWEVAKAEQRDNWGVKWAAPTTDGGVEYLWVEPLAWSPFRIEGLLANQPRRPLEGGHELGSMVSFPIEQLADWMYLRMGQIDGPRDGGFTIEVIEKANAEAGG